MPVFISYSHSDSDFAERLATQLVRHRTNVWLDKWEMRVGDSLLNRIQDAITDSSALLVILSPNSVKSEWCNKELNAGLIRELDEKRVIVLPLLIEDCEIPLFLKDKMYADFRTNFDKGLAQVVESTARVTNEWRNRIEEPTWHTDWAIDWGEDDNGGTILRLTLVDVTQSNPYSVLTVISLVADDDATNWYKKLADDGNDDEARRTVVEHLSKELTKRDARVILEDQFEKTTQLTFQMDCGMFLAVISSRWLGTDTGMDVLFNTAQQIEGVVDQMRLARPAQDAE